MRFSDCQELIDSLWNIGIRPSENLNPTKGALQAKQEHINDLRSVLFSTLKIKPLERKVKVL